jgi:crossover junction endodeoxyribonuclease RuvC
LKQELRAIGDALAPPGVAAAQCVLGIDPGKCGALALLDIAGGALEVADVPTLAIRGKTVIDHYGLARIVDAWATRNPVVFVEQVGSRPGEGHAGAFDFGRTCGLILGVLSANFLRVEFVTPSKWKADLKVKGDKDESRQRAATLFPRQSGLFARVKDDGRAEAALIAAWGAQTLGAVHGR